MIDEGDPYGLGRLPDPLPITPIDVPLEATVKVPGSKSLTNRALVCAALATGRSTLRGALLSDDTDAMAGVLRSLGLTVETDPGDLVDPSSPAIGVVGCGGRLPATDALLDTRQSGTTSRFVLPMLLAGAGRYQVTCHEQMRARPMGTTFEAVAALGAEVVPSETPGHLPATLTVPERTGRIGTPVLRVPGDVSSQFLSGLLLAAPCLPAGARISVVGPLVSRPYVDMTIEVMSMFGATVHEPEPAVFVVEPTGYEATDLRIEPDASAASYPLAAAVVCGGSVTVEGLRLDAVQGDARFALVLGQMGAEVSESDASAGSTTVRFDGAPAGGTFDLTHLSDTAQTLAVVAAQAAGPVSITGIGFIRRKEIDRIAAVATELARCGVAVEVDADGWTVRPDPSRLHPAVIETYDDHRMAMSFALLGLRRPGFSIAGPGCVAKTFPGYWQMLDTLRAGGVGR